MGFGLSIKRVRMVFLKQQARRSQRAVSITEFMIAFVLFAVVAGSFAAWFFLGSRERRIARATEALQESQESAFLALSSIVDEAIRVRGFTENIHPGFRNIQSADPQKVNLEILRVRYPDLAVEIDDVSVLPAAGSIPRRLQFYLKNATEAEYVVSGFLQATDGARYLAFGKGEFQNVLTVTLDPELSNRRVANGTFEGQSVSIVQGPFWGDLSLVPGSVDEQAVIREIDGTSLVSMVEWVSLRTNDLDQIVMIERFKNPGSSEEIVLGEGLLGIDYAFEFKDHRRDQRAQSINLILPLTPLSEWDGSDYHEAGCVPTENPFECCDPLNSSMQCVRPSDLATIYVSFESRRSLELRADLGEINNSLRHENGELIRTGRFSISPKNYGLRLATVGAAIQSTECMDPANRCKPSCRDFFQDDNPLSPSWKGYGAYVGNPDGTSAYCRCGTGGPQGLSNDPETFRPPDTPGGYDEVPSYLPPYDNSRNVRINACIQHFGDVYGFAWKHPMMWTWWNGLRPSGAISSIYRSQNVPSPPNYQKFTWHVDRFEALLADYMANNSTTGFWDEHFQCRLNRDSISNSFRDIFYARSGGVSYGNPALVTAVRAGDRWGPTIGPEHSPATGRFIGPVEEKCICRAHTTENKQTREICNHGRAPDDVVCPNTWKTEGEPPIGQFATTVGAGSGAEAFEGRRRKIYKVNSDGGFTDALRDINLAARCQCLNEIYNRPFRQGAAYPDLDPANMPYSHGHAESLRWDARVDPFDPAFQAGLMSLVPPTGGDPLPMTTTTPEAPALPEQSLILRNQSNPDLNVVPVWPVGEGGPEYVRNSDGEISWGPHRMRAVESPYVRVVRVHYIDSEGGELKLSGPIRCDGALGGRVAPCTRELPAAERSAIADNIVIANPGMPRAQAEAYAPYCTTQCYNEQQSGLDLNTSYVRLGVLAVRNVLSQAVGYNQVPIGCGGRVVTGLPGF